MSPATLAAQTVRSRASIACPRVRVCDSGGPIEIESASLADDHGHVRLVISYRNRGNSDVQRFMVTAACPGSGRKLCLVGASIGPGHSCAASVELFQLRHVPAHLTVAVTRARYADRSLWTLEQTSKSA